MDGLEEAFGIIATHHFPKCPYLSVSTRARLQKAKEDDPQPQTGEMNITEYFKVLAERLMIDDYGTYIGFRPYDSTITMPTLTLAPNTDKPHALPRKPMPAPTKLKKKYNL